MRSMKHRGWWILPALSRVGCRHLCSFAFVALLLISTTGCCTYRSADADPGVPDLLGRRCVLSASADLPTGGAHWLPGWTPPEPYPAVQYPRGTVLRVAHVELWLGPIDPSGSIVFADVEDGPHRGERVVIGVLWTNRASPDQHSAVMCWNDYLGLSAEDGRLLRPLSSGDVGYFLSHDFAEGSWKIAPMYVGN